MKQTTNLIISPQRSHKDHSSVKSISNVNTLSADKNREYFVIFSYINYYKHKRPNHQEFKIPETDPVYPKSEHPPHLSSEVLE